MSEAQTKVDEAVGRVQGKTDALATRFEQSSGAIERRLPPFMAGQGERFVACALTTIRNTWALQDCSHKSLVACVIQAAMHGLMVDGVLGAAYLVPFRNHGTKEAQLQIGYRGFIELLMRSGKFCRVSADTVHEADSFHYEEGSDPRLIHQRNLSLELQREESGEDPRGKVIGAYAIAHPVGGGPASFIVLSTKQIFEHRAASKAWQAEQAGKTKEPTPWTTHPLEMAKKTAIRALSKTLPLSDERYADGQSVALVDEARDAGRPVPVDAEILSEVTFDESA